MRAPIIPSILPMGRAWSTRCARTSNGICIRQALAGDRIDGKHYAIAQRSLNTGGRQDIFLGTRDCQGYVTPCAFGEGQSDYDNDGPVDYSLMFHSFDYPDETGDGWFRSNFWRPRLIDGVLTFPRPDDTNGQIIKKDIRPMQAKKFGVHQLRSVEEEFLELPPTAPEFETGASL